MSKYESEQPLASYLFGSHPRTPVSHVRIDDEIFEHTMKEFPELSTDSYGKLRKIDEEWTKSADGEKRWRKRESFAISVSADIKPLSRYEGKVTDHNFGSIVRMNSEEECPESNTIFGAFRNPVPGSATKPPGSDARAIAGFRGDCWVRNRHRFSNISNVPGSLATAWSQTIKLTKSQRRRQRRRKS